MQGQTTFGRKLGRNTRNKGRKIRARGNKSLLLLSLSYFWPQFAAHVQNTCCCLRMLILIKRKRLKQKKRRNTGGCLLISCGLDIGKKKKYPGTVFVASMPTAPHTKRKKMIGNLEIAQLHAQHHPSSFPLEESQAPLDGRSESKKKKMRKNKCWLEQQENGCCSSLQYKLMNIHVLNPSCW